jgi:hypothetical protein
MAELLSIEDLPDGFFYPREFIRVVELGLVNLEPWRLLQGASLRDRHAGLQRRFPSRQLVPFARRLDNDDVACWQARSGEVVVIHDFSKPGYEQRATFVDFYGWLRQAIEDLILFE